MKDKKNVIDNCDTCVQIPMLKEEKLENIQFFFIRLVLRVPQDCLEI